MILVCTVVYVKFSKFFWFFICRGRGRGRGRGSGRGPGRPPKTPQTPMSNSPKPEDSVSGSEPSTAECSPRPMDTAVSQES